MYRWGVAKSAVAQMGAAESMMVRPPSKRVPGVKGEALEVAAVEGYHRQADDSSHIGQHVT